MKIRQAVPDDLTTLLRFEQGVVRAERPFDPTLREGAIRYYDIAAMLRDVAVHFLIAEQDGAPLGCGFARLEAAKPYLRHAQRGYLGLMYVEPAHRGQGVNAQIMAALQAWCAARGVTELRLDVYHANAGAIRAYRKAGFEPHMVEMRLQLDRSPP
jgi:GNAT superfamily N-acetyltransferase